MRLMWRTTVEQGDLDMLDLADPKTADVRTNTAHERSSMLVAPNQCLLCKQRNLRRYNILGFQPSTEISVGWLLVVGKNLPLFSLLQTSAQPRKSPSSTARLYGD